MNPPKTLIDMTEQALGKANQAEKDRHEQMADISDVDVRGILKDIEGLRQEKAKLKAEMFVVDERLDNIVMALRHYGEATGQDEFSHSDVSIRVKFVEKRYYSIDPARKQEVMDSLQASNLGHWLQSPRLIASVVEGERGQDGSLPDGIREAIVVKPAIRKR